jgi:misacylated tRNA(Ala) deacylase
MEETPILNQHNKEEHRPSHTAEHILNQTMVRLFGCPRSMNAHVEKKKSKCDYLLVEEPTAQQIADIVNTVNEVIGNHLTVTTEYMSKDEAANIVDLRKLPQEASDTLRIVKIGDYDTCACIGDHVENTSEIGTFEIISSDFTKEEGSEVGRWRVRWRIK